MASQRSAQTNSRRESTRKQNESRVFEQLEKEVEHQFQQLQLAYGIVN